MLNIGRMGRMAPGGHDYYLDVVARGVEDYYLARGEAPGRWLGRGVELLDREGRVEGAELAAVLAGDHPSTGERLAAHPARKVPGFDLTFRAPKSVSLLWALADDRQVAEEVREAHDAAVAAAIGYLEREAGWTRRGAGGSEAVKVEGFVGAAFRHRTSRAGDPLLHTTCWSPTSPAPWTTGSGERWTRAGCTRTPRPPGRSTRRTCGMSSPTGSGSRSTK